MEFIGVDLTSAFARRPRKIDIAVLEESLAVSFYQAVWPESRLVTARDAASLRDMLLKPIERSVDEPVVLAIDGPQGLARFGEPRRVCERILGTPGRTPCQLPEAAEGMPFQAYIRSSIDLFAALLLATPRYRLAGFDGVAQRDANLFEVFPGAEWAVFAGGRLPAKSTRRGREFRYELFKRLGISIAHERLPSADQNDALVGAYLAWCVHNRPDSVELVGAGPTLLASDLQEGLILHATARAQAEFRSSNLVEIPVRSLESTEGDAESRVDEGEEDWNSDDSMLLFLTDYGAVHGTEPENKWMRPGEEYTLESQPPDKQIRFQLNYAATYSGGRAWRASPTVKDLVRQLGYQPPIHLNRTNGVTVRVKAIC